MCLVRTFLYTKGGYSLAYSRCRYDIRHIIGCDAVGISFELQGRVGWEPFAGRHTSYRITCEFKERKNWCVSLSGVLSP